MKTPDKNFYDFGSRSLYQIQFDSSIDDKKRKKFESQQFIVPWQLNESRKKEVLIE